MDAERLIEIAVEDVRVKLAATFELIRFIDQQAMALLGLQTTLAVAAVTGFGASLGPAPLLPFAAGVGLLSSAVALVSGAACCMRVVSSATIATPGRDPDFWRWAHDNKDIVLAAALSAYLDGAEQMVANNRALNDRGARWFAAARYCSVAAPILAIATAFSAWSYGL